MILDSISGNMGMGSPRFFPMGSSIGGGESRHLSLFCFDFSSSSFSTEDDRNLESSSSYFFRFSSAKGRGERGSSSIGKLGALRRTGSTTEILRASVEIGTIPPVEEVDLRKLGPRHGLQSGEPRQNSGAGCHHRRGERSRVTTPPSP